MPMACTNCSSPLSENARFCDACGQAVITETDLEVQCPLCGIGNKREARFCASCGASIFETKPGIPIGSVSEWQEAFTGLGWLPDLKRKKIAETPTETALRALLNHGFTWPPNNESDPWIIYTRVPTNSKEMKLTGLDIVDMSQKKDIVKGLVSREYAQVAKGLIVVASRCRIGVVKSWAFVAKDPEKLEVFAADYVDITGWDSKPGPKQLFLHTTQGYSFKLSWALPGLPAMPQGLASLVALGSKNPTDAYHFNKMHYTVKQGRQDNQDAALTMMEYLGAEISNVRSLAPPATT